MFMSSNEADSESVEYEHLIYRSSYHITYYLGTPVADLHYPRTRRGSGAEFESCVMTFSRFNLSSSQLTAPTRTNL